MRPVIKIGGSVLRSGSDFRRAAEYVTRFKSAVVVVSAMKGVTDLLIMLHETGSPSALSRIESAYYLALAELGLNPDETSVSNLLRELRELTLGKPRASGSMGPILSFGERLSARIMHWLLKKMGVNVALIENPLITTDDDVDASPLPESINWIREYVNYADFIVVPGFIGVTKDGKWTTIGRGGSDYTATYIAAAIASPEVHLITDVDGIYSGDPGKVRDPVIVPRMSIREAMALAKVGGKKFHVRTFEPLIGTNTVVRVRNYASPGTAIADGSYPPPIKVAHESPRGTYLIGEGISKLGLAAINCCIAEVHEPIDQAHEKYVKPLYRDLTIL